MWRLSRAESMLLRVMVNIASFRGRGGALAILIFHRVLSQRDELMPSEPDVQRFSDIAGLLADNFQVLPLREAVDLLEAGRLPPRAACITFDDGYADNCELAMPILQKRGLPATVFVASGYLNGGAMFNDIVIEAVRAAPERLDLTALHMGVYQLDDLQARRRAIESILASIKYLPANVRQNQASRLAALAGIARLPDLMMSDSQVKRLHQGGIEVGAHTVTHPILAVATDAVVRNELVENKRFLEQLIGAPVTSFAYPNGVPNRDYRAKHTTAVREAGFKIALTTAWGCARRGGDLYQLPRLSPWDSSPGRYGMRLVRTFASRRFARAD
jgi:peptidoglycan/xylan/chitin deacetylase (PgdA/CDA1 family)